MSTVELVLLSGLGLAVAGAALVALTVRPQRGLIVLAALLPFDGLLLLVPGGERLGPWKEVALLLVAASALAAPASARRRRDGAGRPTVNRSWVFAAVAFVVLTVTVTATRLLTGAFTGADPAPSALVALVGLKVDFFYVLVPLVLWRCPFDRAERDRLVSVLMATGVVVALVGVAQQAAGPERLHALGYEYNDAIRFSGGLLRSFSTFTQPFSFGLYVMVVVLVGLPVALADRTRLRNRLFLLATPLLVVGMVTSVVRGALLGLVVGVGFLAWWRHRGLAHTLVPVGLVTLALPAAVLGPLASGTSLGERTTGWSQIGGLVVDAPLGHGAGATGAAAAKAVEMGAAPHQVLVSNGAPYQPDSYYVKTLLELGPLGLWLLLLIVAAALAVSVGAARSGPVPDQPLAAGVAATLVAAAAASLVSTYLEIFPLDFYFWLLLGVLLCLEPSSRSTLWPCARGEAASRPISVSSSSR